jgi:anti-sigma factor RsiW
MRAVDEELEHALRVGVRDGTPPSRLLREVVRQIGPDRADRQFLARLLRDSFRFAEGEGHVVFGWMPDGTGPLSDAQLDYHLSKRIAANRERWDTPYPATAA